MTFFNTVLNFSIFLVGFALLVLSLYLKYNNTFACVTDDKKAGDPGKAKTARVCLDIIVFMSISMLLLPLGCYMCAGDDTFTSASSEDDVWAFGKLGTLPLAFAGAMGLTVIVCGAILYSFKNANCKDETDVSSGIIGVNTALQWLLGFGSAMTLFGFGGAIVHHNQLVKTGNVSKKKGKDKKGKEIDITSGALMPEMFQSKKAEFGQRRSRFSNRSR